MRRYYALLLILLLITTGCSQTLQTDTLPPEPTPGDTAVPTAEAVDTPESSLSPTEPLAEGTAGILGTLYNTAGDGPLPGTAFYLTPAMGPESDEPPAVFSGAQSESGDVSGQSGAQGELLLADIPPGSYYLVVWAPYNWLLATEDKEGETPRLIALEPDQWHDLGRVYVSWP